MSNIKKGAAGAVCSVMVIIGIVLSSGEVKTSRAGLELIGNAEGCRRDPYKCPADVWTDGVGNTSTRFIAAVQNDTYVALSKGQLIKTGDAKNPPLVPGGAHLLVSAALKV